jgi:TonB family protein
MSEGTLPPTITASLDERRARQRRTLWMFCGLSLGVHLGLFVGWMVIPAPDPPAVNLDAVVKTRLVKLGKPRDEKLLPRLPTAPAPAAQDKKSPKLDEPTPEKQTPEAEKKSASSILERLKEETESTKDVNDIIRNKIGEQTDEGQLDGDKDGDALKGEIKASYFNRVTAHIKRNLEISSTITDEERVRLRAELAIKVDADGNVVDARIQKSSGNSRYDNDVLAAAKRGSPVPAPPPDVRDLAAKGIAFNVCPQSCS